MDLVVEQKIVVAFDICSSSNIIEDLTLTDNLKEMRRLIIFMKKFLMRKAKVMDFNIYKFTGDGWILLFPHETKGRDIMRLLTELSELCRQLFRRVISFLENKPMIRGLTFGIEEGSLVRLKMAGRIEYVGRPLNIACRLQSAIKDKDRNPAYKVLISRHAFRRMFRNRKQYKPQYVRRKLRNIRGGDNYYCVKLKIFLKNKE